MKAVWIPLLLFGCVLGQTAGSQQTPPTPSQATQSGQADNSNVKPEDKCSVEGKVLSAITGEPLKKTHVMLRRMDSTTVNAPPYGAVTDAAGHFLIEKIDPGRYHMSADRTGYVRSDSTPKRLTTVADTLTLNAGQKLGDLQFRLTPQAVITGRVVDEDNEPVANVRVQCTRYRYMNGKKTLVPMGSVSTNDKGEYRAYGLAAGKCFVSATYMQQFMGPTEIRSELTQEESYVPTYYPNAVDTGSAMQVDVAAGVEVSGVDIRLVRAKTVVVSGTIMNRSKPSLQVQISLSKHDNPSFSFDSVKRGMTDGKGRFVFRGVMPGTYDIRAVEYSAESQRVAVAQVNVGDSNVDGLQLVFIANPEIKGALTIESPAQQPQQNAEAAPAYQVYLSPETSAGMYGGSGGEVKEDGTFTLKNVAPEKYRLSVYPLQDEAYVKQVAVGNKEMADGRIDFGGGGEGQQIKVVVSLNGAHVEGSVLDSKQQPSPHATVVLVPDRTDATQRYKSGTTDQNGHYVLRGIAPGKYKLYAFDQIDAGAFYDTEYMKPYESKGESLDVTEGSKLTHDLQLISNDEMQ
jgi:protocatechuate 3,4-dioxygenase beta subunit